MKQWIVKWAPSIVFNVGEMVIIILLGLWLNVDINIIVLIIFCFVIPRLLLGEPKHYKSWQLCLIWTTAAFLSMFVLTKAGIFISIIMTITFAIAVSGKSDYVDLFLWKPRSKYHKEIEFVKYNPLNENLTKFEEQLKAYDNLTYLCYLYIFKERLSWEKTAEKLDTETQRLTPIVDKIAFGLRVSCHI